MLLVRRKAPERWAGLWDFPRFTLVSGADRDVADELVGQVGAIDGISHQAAQLVTTIKHSVTRFRITLGCYRADCLGRGARQPDKRSMRWVLPEQLADFPLSTSAHTLARLVAADNAVPAKRR